MTENMDREDTMFEVEDTIDKIKFLVDDFMEQYGFNSTEEMDEKKSFFFAHNKQFMTMKLLILSDYAWKAKQAFKALESMEQKA
jgi:hypothetical protein|nr:MAG TPA: hypothetical protein [Caudoviricetes sp.]